MKALSPGIRNAPLVVLVNEGTAASSEIVAAALQDYKRAVIVGTRTAGRTSVQTFFPLRSGSGLNLTTGRWVPPRQKSLYKSGINPDVLSLLMPEEEPQKTPGRDSQLEHGLMILRAIQNTDVSL